MNGKTMDTKKAGTAACIDKKDHGDHHQLQLWILSIAGQDGYHFELRQAYRPGGKTQKHCVLDSGPLRETREEAAREGIARFSREVANLPAETASMA
jgi:hypothetical protein